MHGHAWRRIPGYCALLALLLTGCVSRAGGGTRVTGSPTTTSTPSGDLLLIDGRTVRAVFIPDSEQDPLYALTDDALFVHDGGFWVSTGTPNDGRLLLVDPDTPERLFLGNHPSCHATDTSPVPFGTSIDGGRTWTTRPSGQNVLPLAVDPSFPDTIYGSDCSLAISWDAGLTWSRLHLMPGYEILDLAFVGNRLLALGQDAEGAGRLREIDLSDPLTPRPGDILLERPGIDCVDADKQRIVVGGEQGVYVSDDGGATWSESRSGLEEVTWAGSPSKHSPPPEDLDERIGVLAVEMSPGSKHRIFAGTTGGLYLSQDDGSSWVRYDAVPEGEPVLAIQFGLGGADLYITTSQGVIVVPNP